MRLAGLVTSRQRDDAEMGESGKSLLRQQGDTVIRIDVKSSRWKIVQSPIQCC